MLVGRSPSVDVVFLLQTTFCVAMYVALRRVSLVYPFFTVCGRMCVLIPLPYLIPQI